MASYSSLLLLLGFALIFIGILLAIIDIIRSSSKREEEKRTETKAGGIIFIGPIPIVFGSDKEITKWMLIIALIISILLIIVLVL